MSDDPANSGVQPNGKSQESGTEPRDDIDKEVDQEKPDTPSTRDPSSSSEDEDASNQVVSDGGTGKRGLIYRTWKWIPKPARYDPDNPPKFTVWLNILFAFVSHSPFFMSLQMFQQRLTRSRHHAGRWPTSTITKPS